MSAQVPPVFIVGAQRSGTTMLRLMLNAHRSFAVPFESDFLQPLNKGLVRKELADKQTVELALDALANEKFTSKGRIVEDKQAILAHQIGTYAELLVAVFTEYAKSRGKPRWGIKTPSYQTQIDVLQELFPDARVVHIVRDGRDVLVSRRSLPWGGDNTPELAHDWRWQVLMGRKLGRMLGSRYKEMRYEDLIQNPEASLRQLCEFLGETFDTGMLKYHEHAAAEMPSDSVKWHEASVSAPDKGKIYQWKNKLPLPDQILFQEVAGDALATLGYEPVSARSRVRTGLKRIYYALPRRR